MRQRKRRTGRTSERNRGRHPRRRPLSAAVKLLSKTNIDALVVEDAQGVFSKREAVGHQAMRVMTERRARHLPVVEADRIVGLLRIGDMVKSRLTEKQDVNRVLQDIARWPHAD